MSWALAGRPIDSVLLTRLRYLGDIVMSTILIEALRRGAPGLDIGYLCEDGYADVLNNHPGVNRVHRLGAGRSGSDARARVSDRSPGSESRSTLETIGDLRRARYDLAVDMFFNPRSAWLLKLAGIPQRIGGTRKWRGRLYSHQVLRSDFPAQRAAFHSLAPGGLGEHLCRVAPLVHQETGLDFPAWIEDQFGPGDLCPRLGRPAAQPGVRNGLAGLGLQEGAAYLLLAPSATWPSKEWPRERWSQMVSLLLENQDLPLVILSAPGKVQVAQSMGDSIPPGRGGVLDPLPLAGALDVLSGARALLTVDGGIMHAAVGLGIPTLALFGPTDPDIWFPYEGSGPFRVMARAPFCHPCDLHECPAFICLPELEPGDVWEILGPLLQISETGKGGGFHE